MIKNLAALHVGVKQVERASEALGEEIMKTEKSDLREGNACSNTMYLGIESAATGDLDALVPSGCQCHHCLAVLQAQQPL